jgi:hypothetical protein
MMSASDAADVRASYERLRSVQPRLNTTLFRMLSKRALENTARTLGFWEKGRMVVELEDDLDIVADFAIYEHRVAGRNAVDRVPRARRDRRRYRGARCP